MVMENPRALYLLLLLLPVGILALFSYFNGKRALVKLGGAWRFEKLFNVFLVKNFFIYLFFMLFLVFTVLALTDLRWNEELVEDERDGYELCILLDISRSMLADDVSPNRLQVATQEIRWLIDNFPETRFSIVVFKGNAVNIIPVTDDLNAIGLFLETVSPALSTVPGSNLEAGLRVALESFTQAGKYRAIILFTDGENKNGAPLTAASEAGKAGIPVIPVLLGQEAGANIRLGPGNYLRDTTGQMVVSRANRELLSEIASASNGKLYNLNNFHWIHNDLIYIAKRIEGENIDKQLIPVKKQKFEFFLFMALLCLSLAMLTRGIRWKKIS